MSDDVITDDDRRRAFRIDMEKELVDICWHDEQGNERRKKIACLDFSRGGLRLDCDQAIEIGTQVTIVFKSDSTKSQQLSSRVLRCDQNDNGWYQIALQLGD